LKARSCDVRPRHDHLSGDVDDFGCIFKSKEQAGNGNAHAARRSEHAPHAGKVVTTGDSAKLPGFRHTEAIGSYRTDESVFWFDDHSAVAIDHTGLSVDVDLREAKLVVVHDAILRLDDLAAVFVNEAVEAADADCGPVVGERADPVISRGYSDRTVAMDGAAQAAGKRAHRQREGQRFGRTGTVT
jgi:hypothetical protein